MRGPSDTTTIRYTDSSYLTECSCCGWSELTETQREGEGLLHDCPKTEDAPTYTSGEVAALLGVSRQTVRRHIDPVRTPGGHRRYTREQVEQLRRMMTANDVEGQA